MSDDAKVMLRRPGEPWRQPEVAAYSNERELQDLLVESPSLIPGVDRAAAVDEMYLPSGGSVDAVAVAPSGALTLVECKLAANSEIRRAVVGQILSYAASLWRMSYDDFDDRFRQRAHKSLIDAMEAVVDDPTWDAEDFRLAVTEALHVGRFRLIVAVDRITDELKDIIEYLNTHTATELEVLAFELGYVSDGGVEILLPRTHGQETARVAGGGASVKRPHWTVEEVFDELTSLCADQEVAVVRQLHDDVLERGGKLQPGKGSYRP